MRCCGKVKGEWFLCSHGAEVIAPSATSTWRDVLEHICSPLYRIVAKRNGSFARRAETCLDAAAVPCPFNTPFPSTHLLCDNEGTLRVSHVYLFFFPPLHCACDIRRFFFSFSR
jgi:hypothetical protein